MALDKVTAESCGGKKGSFQIDERIFLQVAERCESKSLREQIEGNVVSVDLRDRQAAAIHSDRFAQFQFLRERDFEQESGLFPALLQRDDTACGFDESGKHVSEIPGWRQHLLSLLAPRGTLHFVGDALPCRG